jgi:uncharacterized protein (DUF3084 family)
MEMEGWREMSETDAAEAKRRAEWLHKNKAHRDWIILSVSEVSVIREELLAVERERDEARKEIEGWKNKWDCAVEMAARAENELDDAIKKIWRLEKQIEGSNNFANERFEEIQNVRKQRDKAVAERDDLRDRLNDILNQPALKSCKK